LYQAGDLHQRSSARCGSHRPQRSLTRSVPCSRIYWDEVWAVLCSPSWTNPMAFVIRSFGSERPSFTTVHMPASKPPIPTASSNVTDGRRSRERLPRHRCSGRCPGALSHGEPGIQHPGARHHYCGFTAAFPGNFYSRRAEDDGHSEQQQPKQEPGEQYAGGGGRCPLPKQAYTHSSTFDAAAVINWTKYPQRLFRKAAPLP
jgi:hypothetical protein